MELKDFQKVRFVTQTDYSRYKCPKCGNSFDSKEKFISYSCKACKYMIKENEIVKKELYSANTFEIGSIEHVVENDVSILLIGVDGKSKVDVQRREID